MNCPEALKNDVINKFNKLHPYLEIEDVEVIYYKAESIYLSLAFPYCHDLAKVPENRSDAYRLILLCMEEILERAGCSSAVSYSENGLSISFGSDGISAFLQNLIKGKCKVP